MNSQPSLYDDDGLPLGLADVKIEVGAAVRLFHEDDSYDLGHITSLSDGKVLVDFDDFEMEWPQDDLRIVEIAMLFFVIAAIEPGTLTTDYRDMA